MSPPTPLVGRVAFCVGTGRCGTTFLAQIAGREPDVAASHERLRLAATFHMFCAWNRIAVDPEGFLVDRQAAIAAELRTHRVSFESSALLSHSIAPLFERFGARFLLLVRRPDQTVASFAVRGWFEEDVVRADPDLPPSYRQGEEPRHFFGRNLPRGADAARRWSALTPIGRLGWFWAARNRGILDQFRELPPDHCRIARLEDLDFAHYVEVARFLGWTPQIDAATFTAIAEGRPNAGPHPPRGPEDWTATEIAEFEAEVGPLAMQLGYEHRVDRLRRSPDTTVRHRGRPPTVAEVLDRLP